MEKFSSEVIDKLSYYVYRLVDPRNGNTFYVGKGKGNRAFDHGKHTESIISKLKNNEDEDEDDISLKLQTIKEIRKAGFEVLILIHRHGMTEETAFQVEAALIDAYMPVGNIQNGCDGLLGCANCEQIEMQYKLQEADLQNDKVLFINVKNSIGEKPLYEAVKGFWRLNKEHASSVDYVLAVDGGIIRGVFKADKWENVPNTNRICFEGKEIKEENIVNRYVDHRIPSSMLPKPGARNPCWYSK